jgi:hypothetical protein
LVTLGIGHPAAAVTALCAGVGTQHRVCWGIEIVSCTLCDRKAMARYAGLNGSMDERGAALAGFLLSVLVPGLQQQNPRFNRSRGRPKSF